MNYFSQISVNQNCWYLTWCWLCVFRVLSASGYVDDGHVNDSDSYQAEAAFQQCTSNLLVQYKISGWIDCMSGTNLQQQSWHCKCNCLWLIDWLTVSECWSFSVGRCPFKMYWHKQLLLGARLQPALLPTKHICHLRLFFSSEEHLVTFWHGSVWVGQQFLIRD